ncbi:Nitroreductase family protein [Fulvivirga imtechensis AK7]|uniref:Nitroreductase family protein n=1 Tax=Fulvivirga imtechensis AK7 TaxID=1237149 RepID=L8JRR3_9BACT|nr:nitroreductase family protein [Fulvivirga imtechensis]ELR70883.1 Nitroreductase family protein [Fulvivirga imtechensis AK7]
MPKTKTIDGYPFEEYHRDTYTEEEVVQRSNDFYHWMDQRRTVRDFSDKPIPREVIDNLILTASTAPSGAHKQPWTFCVVSSPDLKKKIRKAAEEEEYESYHGRMTPEWLEDLKPLQTDWHKSFLETAPYLIIVFKRAYELDAKGNKRNNYYVNESVGLAAGFLLTAIHHAGLVALTHTPSPMNFLAKLLDRPANERPVLLIPVGYPAHETYVPRLRRKSLDEVAAYYE